MDVHSPEQRSFNMSKIRGLDTSPELKVRKFLFAKGFRYRINDKRLPGKPDLVFPKYRTVVFVHGCFWHVHEGCDKFKWPKSNREFWKKKLSNNVIRDKQISKELTTLRWKVIVVWECELQRDKFEKTMQLLVENITN